MSIPSLPRRAALGLALSLAGLTPGAQALNIVFTDVSSNGGMTAAQLGAFQQAANYWSTKISDPVTVYINIAFNNLGAGVLGSASSYTTTVDYATLRTALAADATSAIDTVAIASLQAGPALSFRATQANGSARFDNDGSLNNTTLGITSANAKAIGLNPGTNAGFPDAAITFATGFANDFVYTRNGATPGNKTDFITVAQHEIGHALGFVSGVDDVDFCLGKACAGSFETDWWYYPLDLFRYSAPGTLDMTVGGSPYFSVDGGATVIETFSTGDFNGNGWQASHFGVPQLNLMRPYVQGGQAYDATAADLAAFDAIGWDLVTAVPEPASYALLIGGLGVLAWARRRRG